MGTIADKLLYLQDTKSAIKDAIVAKGVSIPTGTPFRNYATKISEISGGEGPTLPQADPYVRPAEWLALPPNVNGVEKVSILKAVFDTDSEFVAFSCWDDYTVDWGDGTVENFTNNRKAEHKYDYSNVNLNSDTVAKFGYKQCIITITPQVGETLTKCLLNQYHTSIGSSSYSMNSGFLDINVNLPNVTSTSNFGIGAESLANPTSYVNMNDLERVCIGQIGLTSLNYLFYNCYSIQEILFDFDTSVVTSWANTFYQCFSLQKCPTIVFNPSGITDTFNMFTGCYNLVEIQDINMTLNGVANIGNMFLKCYSLPRLVLNITSNTSLSLTGLVSYCYSLSDLTLTLSGTGKVRNLANTFSYCYSLTKAPDLDTSSCTTFSSTFSNSGIVVAPDYNYLSAMTLSTCYNGCLSLAYVPDITVSNACTSLSTMFGSCSALTKAPNITGTTGVTNVSNMFSNCTSLTSVPAYSFPAVTGTGIAYMFDNCSSLKVVPAINVGTTFTGNSSFFRNNYALSRMLMRLKYTFSVANAKMSASALNEMFTILPTVTGQTVTITGNYGASTCNTTIATAKGWSVIK